MNSSLCCLWSVIMALIVPNVSCHLSAALKTGSADGKPPILSHVRVSREPRMMFREDVDAKRVPMSPLQTSRIKSPSYQHKVLQFHSNGHTSSGQDFYPTKLFSSGSYPSSKASPVYPVASKVASTRQLVGQTSSDDDSYDSGESWENYGAKWDPAQALLPEPEDPTFTPYIGARALNIPGFFQHLQENINAIYEQKARGTSSSSPQLEDQMAGAVGKEKDGDKEKEEDEEVVKMIAAPTRRGYSSNSEAVDASQLQSDYGMTARDSRSGGPYTLVFQNQDPDAKTRELLHFLGHGKPQFPRANRYNPAWLFTNLGLGKRSQARLK